MRMSLDDLALSFQYASDRLVRRSRRCRSTVCHSSSSSRDRPSGFMPLFRQLLRRHGYRLVLPTLTSTFHMAAMHTPRHHGFHHDVPEKRTAPVQGTGQSLLLASDVTEREQHPRAPGLWPSRRRAASSHLSIHDVTCIGEFIHQSGSEASMALQTYGRPPTLHWTVGHANDQGLFWMIFFCTASPKTAAQQSSSLLRRGGGDT